MAPDVGATRGHSRTRAHSSVGRAPPLQGGGRGFKSLCAHPGGTASADAHRDVSCVPRSRSSLVIVRLPGSLPQDAAARGFGAAGLVRKIFHIWCRNAVNLHKSPRVNTVRTAKCEVNVKKVTLVGDRVRGATPSRLVSTLRTFGRGTRVLKPPFVGPLRGPVIVAMAGVLLLGGSMTYGAVTYSAPVAPVGSPLVVESPALPYLSLIHI